MVPDSTMRLALVDDHPALLAGLATVFADRSEYDIVGTGSSATDALNIGLSRLPDVLVVDLSMPGDVFAVMNRLAREIPTLRLIVLTAYESVELALRALNAGAHAFVLKGRPTDELHCAVDAVRRGELFVSPGFSEEVLKAYRHQVGEDVTPSRKLSVREQQLVDGLLRGLANKEIASELQLTEKTVKHYMTNLMKKLHVKNRVEVVLATRHTPRETVGLPELREQDSVAWR